MVNSPWLCAGSKVDCVEHDVAFTFYSFKKQYAKEAVMAIDYRPSTMDFSMRHKEELLTNIDYGPLTLFDTLQIRHVLRQLF